MTKTSTKTSRKKTTNPKASIDLKADTKASIIKRLKEENAKRKCAKIVPDDLIRKLLKSITNEIFDEIEVEKKTPENKEDEVFEVFKKTHRNATKKDYKSFQYNHPLEWAKLASSAGKVA